MSSALTSQRFCLRWNNHQSNLLTVFDQLLHDESFVDVTLAVEGRFLRAHKMVLSACSPYFQALFVGHPDKHPIVILKDVPYCDMRSLLDFMYRGEVSVDQERLTAFLKVAESLRIKGLTEVNEDRCDLPTITSSLLSTAAHTPPPPAPPPPPHLHRIHPAGHKRAAPPASAANPLLGSALTAPKRKRGRPRKLSGSSPGPGAPPSLLPAAPAPASGAGLSDAAGQQARGSLTVPLDANDLDAHRLGAGENIVVQGSPEMLEVKMGALDFQQNSPPPAPIASSTPCGSRGGGLSRTEAENGQASPDLPRGLSGKDMGVKIKEEPEPTPGPSSQDSEQSFGQSSSEQEQQAFALGLLEAAGHGSLVAAAAARSPTGGDAGVHFLSGVEGEGDEAGDDAGGGVGDGLGEPRCKQELLEYLPCADGSVVCKRCGEVLPSRTHWYRHKYKRHATTPGPSPSPPVPAPAPPPADLFRCERCNTFFKSRRGLAGHVATRHPLCGGAAATGEGDGAAAETAAAAAALAAVGAEGAGARDRRSRAARTAEARGPDYERQREREEKLVADIIEKVRRECEAQGEAVSRRGYSRRSTVMNS